MRMLGNVLWAVGLISVFILPVTYVSAVTIEDGDFYDGTWTYSVDTGVGEGTGVVTRQISGGNPDAFLEVYATGTHLVRISVWKLDFVWDPATDGEICTVALMID